MKMMETNEFGKYEFNFLGKELIADGCVIHEYDSDPYSELLFVKNGKIVNSMTTVSLRKFKEKHSNDTIIQKFFS